MKQGSRPLKLKDFWIVGKASEGMLDLRIIDGEKLASKRLNIAEAVEMERWLSKFIKEYRYRNSVPANIDKLETVPRSANAKLTGEEVDSIRQRLENGEPIRKLADEYGVSQPTISRILNYETYT